MTLASTELLTDDESFVKLNSWYQTAVAYWSAQQVDALILDNEKLAQAAQTMLDALAVRGMSDITLETHGED